MTKVACERGHGTHVSREVHIHLGGPTGYLDLPPIPMRLARDFTMHVWDYDLYSGDGPYCPARDVVSRAIGDETGVWEQVETIITLDLCRPGTKVLDFGAQIGWFSMLAASCGAEVTAYEADPENARMVAKNATANGWPIECVHAFIDRTTLPLAPQSVRFVKIDVEGLEDEVMRVLWPSIEAGLIEFILMEVSPVFAPYYPDLVTRIIAAGYRVYQLPLKSADPLPFAENPEDIWDDLHEMTGDVRATVRGWHQANVLFVIS